MGVLNITPDSFSDGGLYVGTDAAVSHARAMISDGVDLIDIGGESTRPATFGDHSPLSSEEESRRIIPTIARLTSEFPSLTISVDTYKADVATAALDAGARVVNDISGLRFDPRMAPLIARRSVPVILMHMLGLPHDIPLKPAYHDVVADILAFFTDQIAFARAVGIADSQILLDPGLGFGKNTAHNLEILRRLPEFKVLGFPLVIGASRKRFIGEVLGISDPMDRVEGTAAVTALSIANGADIVRVHDTREMVRAARMSDAVVRGF